MLEHGANAFATLFSPLEYGAPGSKLLAFSPLGLVRGGRRHRRRGHPFASAGTIRHASCPVSSHVAPRIHRLLADRRDLRRHRSRPRGWDPRGISCVDSSRICRCLRRHMDRARRASSGVRGREHRGAPFSHRVVDYRRVDPRFAGSRSEPAANPAVLTAPHSMVPRPAPVVQQGPSLVQERVPQGLRPCA